jgi:hypothetical protein
VRQATFKMAPSDPINASKECVFPPRSKAQLSESLLDSYERKRRSVGALGGVRRTQAAGVGHQDLRVGEAIGTYPAFPRR